MLVRTMEVYTLTNLLRVRAALRHYLIIYAGVDAVYCSLFSITCEDPAVGNLLKACLEE